MINGFIGWRLQKVKRKTVSNGLSIIRQFLRYCRVSNCPVAKIEWEDFDEYLNVKSRNHIPPFSKKQLEDIFNWDVARQDYFKTLYYTGLDSADVVNLHSDNIRKAKGDFYIYLESRRKTKNRGQRQSLIIPLHPEIGFLADRAGWLFPYLHRSQTGVDNAYHQLKEYIRRKGWNDRLCIKSFRHSFNQHLKAAGVPYKDRQSFMGHAAGSDITMSYEHESEEFLPQKRKMIEQL